MLSLTYESFRLLVETDPLPHAVVDMRSPASGDLKLPEETKVCGEMAMYRYHSRQVLKLEEYRSGMVPADGCVCIVHDADTAPSVDISDVTCVCFDSRTAPNPSGVVLESVACADIVQHATDHIVLDVRRPDEIANFGKLDFARNVPLHEMMQQLGNGLSESYCL